MSDNFGNRQNRVLSVKDKNLDNVIFQYKTPPLTSEWNLINQIGNQKSQEAVRLSYPSGWFSVEDVLQDWSESDAQTGQVLCSESYNPNIFKFVSKGDNIALVNGWPILVQGTNSPDSNNIIQLSTPTSQRYDFVFLEVWRKLVAYDEEIYPYGNITLTPYSNNQILWPPVGTETTKRVQIQYRIRSVSLSTELSPTSDIFSDISIYPIGGRTSGEYYFSTFRAFGSEDIGLYIAGDGSEDHQTALDTVDGYVYAIPMFLVSRRAQSNNIFGPTQLSTTYVNKSRHNNGYRSDRPDSKYTDVIYSSDIIDFRHKILSSGKDLDDSLNKTISKLVSGQLTTALKKGFSADGQLSTAYSGGSTPMKLERINSTGGDDIPNIGDGSNTTAGIFKRRCFSNAEVTLNHNIIAVPRSGSTWQDGETVVFSTAFTFPDGEITSVDGFYSPTLGVVTGITANGTISVTVNNTGGNSIVGTSSELLMEFTFKYHSSTSGFKDVPQEFLEVNKGVHLPIATHDNTIPLRFNNSGDLLNFGLNPNNGDTDQRDYIRYAGGNYTENYEFGHEMVIHRTTNAFNKVTLSLTDSKLNGYYILGVKRVELYTGTGYAPPADFIAERIATTSPYAISNYVVTLPGCPNCDIRITLYTGSKFINDVGDPYSISDSFKFFKLSKQGRGIIDTYETIEAIAEEDLPSNPGSYIIETDKPIIALATKTRTESGFEEGYPFGFKFDSNSSTVAISPSNINQSLPVLTSTGYSEDLLPTKIKVQATSGLGKIRIPVLVHSYVTNGEAPYNFYYKFSPYQGLLSGSSSFYGEFQKEGPAVITTLGSGAITDYIYNDGEAIFTTNSRSITGQAASGVSPKWTHYVKENDYIYPSGSSQAYRILSVDSDTSLTIAERFVGVTVTSSYSIIRLDTPDVGIANVIDRLPAYSVISGSDDEIADYLCYSDSMDFNFVEESFLSTAPKIKPNDPINALLNDFILGKDTSSKRGRNNFVLSDSENRNFKISTDQPRPYIKYEKIQTNLSDGHKRKIYQFYLFNRSAKSLISGETDKTGRIYMVVVSSERVSGANNELLPFYNVDTVDAFELLGRPILK